MANIRLKGLLSEAEDFQARSKETGKLVHFKSKDAYQAALKAGSHEDPKAKKGEQPKGAAKPNDMFGGDYAKDRGGESPKVDAMATVNSIAAKTGLRAQAVAGWADENGVNLSKVSADIDSKKLKPMDFMTAVTGNSGNKYAKDIIAKYSQSAPKADNIDGLTSYKDFTKFYKANSDKLNKDDVPYIVDEIEALKYLESDYKRGDADWEEVLVAYEDLQDLIKKSMISSDDTPKVASPKADVKSIVKDLLKKADKEFRGVHKLKDIADDLNIDDTDGGAGNMLQVRIDKGEDGVYVQTDETEGVIVFNDGTQYKLHHVEDGPIPVTQIGVDDSKNDGQTDDELYDALYDMGYDFGELGSDDFDEEGFADAAMSLGYRYDDKNKVWNHRDNMKESSTKLTSMIKK